MLDKLRAKIQNGTGDYEKKMFQTLEVIVHNTNVFFGTENRQKGIFKRRTDKISTTKVFGQLVLKQILQPIFDSSQ